MIYTTDLYKMISMVFRVLPSHVLNAFILSLILQTVFCIPVPDTNKGQEIRITSAVESNRVSSKHNQMKLRIFETIMKANAARKNVVGHDHGQIVGQIVLPGSKGVEEQVELFQGDIVMTKAIKTALQESGTDEIIISKGSRHRQRRAASNNHLHQWPVVNGSRQFPYVIEASSVPDQSVILQAMNHWRQKVPCVTFVPRTTQPNYVSFFAGQGCYSWTGRTGGKQSISIGQGCAVMGVVAHEIGHALGFWHEQSRPDRDKYVKILWNNIKTDKEKDFMKIDSTNDLGVPYDLNSLMHFGPTTLAKAEGLNTIEKLDGSTDFGEATGLSDNDVQQATLLLCPGTNACKSLYNDTTVDCEAWSILGHCENDTYKAYMKINCQKSCICRVCEDKHVNCAAYIAGGYCTHPQYKLFMEVNCRKGCKLCT